MNEHSAANDVIVSVKNVMVGSMRTNLLKSSIIYSYTRSKRKRNPGEEALKEIYLQPWEEIVGTLKKIKVENNQTTAVIRCNKQLNLAISYLNGTREAEILQALNKLLGKKVAILRTDMSEKPILVRTV